MSAKWHPMNMIVKFKPSGRGKARCKPNPEYPHGVKVEVYNPDKPNCTVHLDYPAPECGIFDITCKDCGMTVCVTAAGRVDDPVSVRFNCLEKDK